MTSAGVRPVRVISRIDCCGKIGAIAVKPPTARTARTWPGVARPRRSPRPADVRVPRGRGRSHSRWRRSAAAFFGEVGPTRTTPVGLPAVSPSKSPRIREAPVGAAMARRWPAFPRTSAHSAPAPSTREAATRSRFNSSSRVLTRRLPRRSGRLPAKPKLRGIPALPSSDGQTGAARSTIRSVKTQRSCGSLRPSAPLGADGDSIHSFNGISPTADCGLTRPPARL